MLSMAASIRAQRPECEVLILGCELPNPDCEGWTGTQGSYDVALDSAIGASDGIQIVKILQLYRQIRDIKGFYSLTTNFVNHPNDFLIRIYAQLLCKALGVASAEVGQASAFEGGNNRPAGAAAQSV